MKAAPSGTHVLVEGDHVVRDGSLVRVPGDAPFGQVWQTAERISGRLGLSSPAHLSWPAE